MWSNPNIKITLKGSAFFLIIVDNLIDLASLLASLHVFVSTLIMQFLLYLQNFNLFNKIVFSNLYFIHKICTFIKYKYIF